MPPLYEHSFVPPVTVPGGIQHQSYDTPTTNNRYPTCVPPGTVTYPLLPTHRIIPYNSQNNAKEGSQRYDPIFQHRGAVQTEYALYATRNNAFTRCDGTYSAAELLCAARAAADGLNYRPAHPGAGVDKIGALHRCACLDGGRRTV